MCSTCRGTHTWININNDTVIKEFSANYYLNKSSVCCYKENDRFCVLVRYCDFINDPDKYIEMAYKKLSEPINNEVHWRDLR